MQQVHMELVVDPFFFVFQSDCPGILRASSNPNITVFDTFDAMGSFTTLYVMHRGKTMRLTRRLVSTRWSLRMKVSSA